MDVEKRLRWLMLAIFLAALLLRLGYLLELKANSPFFQYLICDSSTYHGAALEILGKAPAQEFTHTSYYQPPLYPYFLAAMYKIFSVSLLAPRIIQSFLGALSCVLVFLVTARHFDWKAATLAGFVAAAYRNFIFFDGELLTASLGMFLGLLGLYLAELALSQKDFNQIKRYLLLSGSGLSFGLFAITIPNILLFFVFLFLYIFLWSKLEKPRLAAVIFAFAFMLPITVVTARNYAVSGESVLISHNGGLNFYLGNNPRSEETIRIRPGPRWYETTHLPLIATDRRSMSGPERSRWYFKEAFSYIASRPGHYLLAQARKIIRFFNHVEIPRNADFYHLKSFSRILSFNFVTFHLISPLALLGLWIFRRKWRELAVLYAYFFIKECQKTHKLACGFSGIP